MRVLITGATGFIGSHLCVALHRRGYECVALSRRPASAKKKIPLLSAVWPWSTSEVPDSEAFDGVDTVINLAGEPVAGLWTKSKKDAIEKSRVIGTNNLLKGILDMQNPLTRLVSMSAIGFYGPRGNDVLTESEGGGDTFLAGVAMDWERNALIASQHGIKTAIFRLGLVLGHDGGLLQKMWLPFNLGLGGPLGSGSQWWSWVHMDDVINAIMFVMDNPNLEGTFNLTSPEPVQQKEFAKVLGNSLGRPAFIPLPEAVIRLMLGSFSQEILSSQRVIPNRLQMVGYSFKHRSLTTAISQVVAQKRGLD